MGFVEAGHKMSEMEAGKEVTVLFLVSMLISLMKDHCRTSVYGYGGTDRFCYVMYITLCSEVYKDRT